MGPLDEELFHACGEDGDPVHLRRLIAKGANVNWKHPTSGGTPLHSAVECGRKSVVGLLIESGADVNALDGQGWAPLCLAVDAAIDSQRQTGKPLDLGIVRTLLEMGADPRAGASPDSTALALAERYGESAVHAELLAHVQD
jgi:ankyrin repeat protein